MFSKQRYSQLQGYERRNIDQELPATHTHRHTYVHTQGLKKVIFVSIYLNEMATVLAMFIII